jgi:propanediol dehydratase small subunit
VDEQKLIEKIVREIIASMENTAAVNPSAVTGTSTGLRSEKKLTISDYPLAAKRPELIRTPTNKGLDEITLQGVLDGKVTAQDVRITGETLILQSEIAESAGRSAFAGNLKRAAELTAIPDDRILEIYNALRPYRSTKKQLLGIADELETKYKAFTIGAMVREAVDAYEIRNRLLAE